MNPLTMDRYIEMHSAYLVAVANNNGTEALKSAAELLNFMHRLFAERDALQLALNAAVMSS